MVPEIAIIEERVRTIMVSRWLKRTAAHARKGIIKNAHLNNWFEKNQSSKINPLKSITRIYISTASALSNQSPLKIVNVPGDLDQIIINEASKIIPETSPR